ncbi:MAG: IclR family transcriptional regulator [Candidatus Fimivivens sp.]
MAQAKHRSTQRVIDILELLTSGKEQGQTLTEIADTIKAPKSSILPILHTLLDSKLLSLDKNSGKYAIGIGAFVIGSTFLSNQHLYQHIKEIMENVVLNCKETCQLGILDRHQVLYIAKVDSSESIRLISRVGMRLPLHCTSLGKALMLDLGEDEIRQLLDMAKMMPFTANTITQPDLLIKQLKMFKADDMTLERAERDPEVCCYAIPIRNKNRIIAALSISIPAFRCNEEKINLVVKELKVAQSAIEKIMQDTSLVLDAHYFA